MNKAELLAYIATLVAQLTELNIEFTPAETKGTNAELEQEIERLESLLPDELEETDEPAATDDSNEAQGKTEQALSDSKSEDKALKQDAAAAEQATRRVFVNKGVNIETTINKKKIVLKGGAVHTLDEAKAKSIVAENHGRYATDEDEQADEV